MLPRRRRARRARSTWSIGRGVVAGDHLWKHPDVNGVTFTGSYPVGMDIYKNFATDVPKPVICEMGGKNPTIVTKNADLDKATDGVLRSAFGFGGQKCSACCRVYVEREVYDDFLSHAEDEDREASRSATRSSATCTSGPIINEPAMETYEEAAEEARKNGNDRHRRAADHRGRLRPRPVRRADGRRGARGQLDLEEGAVRARSSRSAPFDELDDAIEKANDTEYGLTAGFFSEDEAEIDEWLDRIQAGVVYVNRRAGSTTGAWPGVQPFGGWKGSGTTGKAGGGPYYVLQYLREQSRTVIAE